MISLRAAQQILDVDDILNTSNVKRFHMIAVARNQTLAEHQYLVAMLSTKILFDCANLGHPNLTSVSRMLLEEALIHDSHEVNCGDAPANPVARARVKDLTGGLELTELVQEDYWNSKAKRRDLPQPKRTSESVVRFVKIADCLEAMYFYALNGDPRTYNLKSVGEGMVTKVIKATQAITAKDEEFLCLNHSALNGWIKRELMTWSSRFNYNFGHAFWERVQQLTEEAFPS